MQTLRSAEWAGGAPMLTGAALFTGFYLNELLMKLLARHDPHAGAVRRLRRTRCRRWPAPTTRTPGGAARLRAACCCARSACCPTWPASRSTQQPLQPRRALRAAARGRRGRAARGDGALTRRRADRRCRRRSTHGSLRGAAAGLRAPALPALQPPLRALLHYHLGSPPLRTRQVDARRCRALDTLTATAHEPAPHHRPRPAPRHDRAVGQRQQGRAAAQHAPLGIPSVVRAADAVL